MHTPPPPPEEIARRKRKLAPKFFIPPSEISSQDISRVRSWANALVNKHENKFNYKWKKNEIVTSGDIKPEDIDIKSIYPFANLHWIIFRDEDPKTQGILWSLVLLSRRSALIKFSYAKI